MKTFVYGCAIACMLAACTGGGTGSDLRFGAQTVERAQTAIDQVPARAESIDAQGQATGGTAAVVTYSGSLDDFVACETRDSDLQGRLSLDLRSTLTAEATDIVVSSLYIVTLERPAFAPVSTSFNQSGTGTFPNGLRCKATNGFENALLGQ